MDCSGTGLDSAMALIPEERVQNSGEFNNLKSFMPRATPINLPETASSSSSLSAAFHRAYADELQSTFAGLPMVEGDRVLDKACVDGAYTPWLARHVGPAGSFVGVSATWPALHFLVQG
jgi:hypothetical protein